MFPSAALFVTVLLVALSAVSKPIIIQENIVKVALSRRLNVTSANNLIRHDQARARYLRNRGHALASGNFLKRYRGHAFNDDDDCDSTTSSVPASTTTDLPPASGTEVPITTTELPSSSSTEASTTLSETSTASDSSTTSDSSTETESASTTPAGTSTSDAPSPTATDIDQPVDNQAVTYIASIDVGNPPTTYQLIIDTGSSNTWIGAATPYTPTNTSSDTGESVSVTYGSGSFSGKEFIDQVVLTDGLVLTQQSIGVADTTSGFDGVDGILGIGPAILTQGSLSPSTDEIVPTVTDNAFKAGIISSNKIGISFEPTTEEEVVNGVLTWGGVDETKFTGELVFAPITSTSPASFYWGVDQNITYGSSTTILDFNAGIVDTGTTLIYLATDAYNRYIEATGATLDSTTGLLTIPSSSLDSLESLFFNINGESFEFTANAQLWPRSLNTVIGGDADAVYLIVADLGENSGSGLDFINGYAFLERFYTVYDTENSQIGFGRTPFTNATTN